jgi:DNA-binding Lrp family transcriptional regulator
LLLPEDEPLLAELGRDGRASHAALATAIHWHESTVRRRISELRHSGLLHFEVDVDSQYLGMNVSALLWLKVEPSRLAAVGHALAQHPEVPFAAATTGPANVVVTALFRDTQHLYEYLTGPLASLPGVSSVETAPIIRTLKLRSLRRWSPPWSGRSFSSEPKACLARVRASPWHCGIQTPERAMVSTDLSVGLQGQPAFPAAQLRCSLCSPRWRWRFSRRGGLRNRPAGGCAIRQRRDGCVHR